MLTQVAFLFYVIQSVNGITSPIQQFTSYNHSVELQTNVADLWWTVDERNQTILFELHIKTTGWIALGISPAGGMTGADIGVGWIDQTGRVYFQDRYAKDNGYPMIDNTTTDWFALQGREQNGWTAIQFKRLLDTCDSMDVAIKSGTNYLIFAYGLTDPSVCPPISDITYHENRRGSKILSLRSYSDPPLQSKFAELTYFDFRLNNYSIPNDDTVYHCKIYKIPSNFSTKRHVIAHEILINSTNPNLIHHLLLHECSPHAHFNDSNLPDDLCDKMYSITSMCSINIAIAWAVGGELISEYPPEVGYPIGNNFSVKYYLVQMHYDNPQRSNVDRDSSGIRFYLGNQLRQYDMGYFTFGVNPDPVAIAIPPQVENFIVDSYCPVNFSRLFPSTGIKLIYGFAHTHLQGKSVSTKLIQNETVVRYLDNAESYNFSYQFISKLPEPIQLYSGDTFLTRCVYNTKNKNQITLGGESTKHEMCLHIFAYYPRIDNLYTCLSTIIIPSWRTFLNNSTLNNGNIENYFMNINWTSNLAVQWQDFYHNATRAYFYGDSGNLKIGILSKLPSYVDLQQINCTGQIRPNNSTTVSFQCSSASHPIIYSALSFLLFFIYIYII